MPELGAEKSLFPFVQRDVVLFGEHALAQRSTIARQVFHCLSRYTGFNRQHVFISQCLREGNSLCILFHVIGVSCAWNRYDTGAIKGVSTFFVNPSQAKCAQRDIFFLSNFFE